MFKIANQIIDAHDDATKDILKKVASKNPSCYMLSEAERSELKDHDFALSVITKKASKLNKFPINSADSTWLSQEFFNETHHKLPAEAAVISANNIKVACDKFGIKASPKVAHFAKLGKANSNVYIEKEGAVKPQVVARYVQDDNLSKLANVKEIGDNYTAAQYAMPTEKHVKIACGYFEKNHTKMSSEARFKYAAAIQRRAHELGMGSQKGTIQKFASDHYSPQIDVHIRSRASLLEHKPEHKSMVEKLGSAKKFYTPSQFAQILHGFDKQAGLNRYYGSGLTDPFLATFASQPAVETVKVASKSMTGDDLQKVVTAKYAQIKNHFGSSLADELKNNPSEIFASLPNDAKEIIAGILEGTH